MGTADGGGIGVRNEMAVHAALKKLYCEPGDVLEGEVGPFVVDILKDVRVVEVQGAVLRPCVKKLSALLTEQWCTLSTQWLKRSTLFTYLLGNPVR